VSFEGDVSEPATVVVAGVSANVSSNNVFEASATLTTGTNTVSIAATDFSGNANASTNNFQVVVADGVSKTLTYDLNDNCTSDGVRTYEWDAADRLVKITQGIHDTEMIYDGLGRRVRIIEKESDVVVSDKRFVWTGTEIAEERDSTGANVVKRFFPQGVQIVSGPNTGNYFWTRDHLGSVREMTDNSGSVRARYDYTPYGAPTKISGDLDSDFLFTGHFFHASSGLHLALYRAYDAELGRWLSRDPIGEERGLNLYVYVASDPVNLWDPFGLENYSFNVITIIRPPDIESGTKSIQTVNVDASTGKIISATSQVGTTSFFGLFDVKGVKNLSQEVELKNGVLKVRLKGYAQSKGFPARINYDLTFTACVDKDGKVVGPVSVSGTHDGYPSYEGWVEGDLIYDFQQGSLGELFGSGDVTVTNGKAVDK